MAQRYTYSRQFQIPHKKLTPQGLFLTGLVRFNLMKKFEINYPPGNRVKGSKIRSKTKPPPRPKPEQGNE